MLLLYERFFSEQQIPVCYTHEQWILSHHQDFQTQFQKQFHHPQSLDIIFYSATKFKKSIDDQLKAKILNVTSSPELPRPLTRIRMNPGSDAGKQITSQQEIIFFVDSDILLHFQAQKLEKTALCSKSHLAAIGVNGLLSEHSPIEIQRQERTLQFNIFLFRRVVTRSIALSMI